MSVAHHQAPLVVFWILEDMKRTVNRELNRADPPGADPFGLICGRHQAVHRDVNVKPVLHRLDLGNPLERKLRPTRGEDVGPVGVSLADLGAQNTSPELGQLARLTTVSHY